MADFTIEEQTDEVYSFTWELEPGVECRIEVLTDDKDKDPGIVMDLSFEGSTRSGPLMMFNATIEGGMEDPTETWTLFQVMMQIGRPPHGGAGEWVYEQDNIDTRLDELEEPALARIAKQAWDIAHKEVETWLLQNK